MPRFQSSHRSPRVDLTEPAVGSGHSGRAGGRGNAHRAAQLQGRGNAGGDDASFDWLSFDPAELDAARATHAGAVDATDTATGARDTAAQGAASAHAAVEAAHAHEAAVQATTETQASALEVDQAFDIDDLDFDELNLDGLDFGAGRGAAAAPPPAAPEDAPADTPAPASTQATEPAAPAEDTGPSEAELAAQQTAEAEAQAAEADQALADAESTLADATEGEQSAAEDLAATEMRAEEAEQAAEAAEEAQANEEAAAADAPVVGQDVSLADTLNAHPEGLALMGLEQYADRPEVGRAAARAIESGDWKALRSAGLSEDEAKAVFNTVEAVRIGLENTSHVVSFEEGTVIDDQVGRDEIVIPGVASWDEVEQTQDGDDLLLETAEGTVRVVGFYDESRGNVARIRLADGESDIHTRNTQYRDAILFEQGLDERAADFLGRVEGIEEDYQGQIPSDVLRFLDSENPDKQLAAVRDNAMGEWGDGVIQDVRTMMFGASNWNKKELRKGHNKILGRHYDPREHYGHGHGAKTLAQSDRALQDLSYFSSLDEAGKERHVKNIAKKGQSGGFLGKVLGVIGVAVSILFGPIVGAVFQGIATVAQGGSLLDGIKVGLGSLMAGGGLGGGAVTRIAGSALLSDGDPAAIALSAAGFALENSSAGSFLNQNHITVDGRGIGVGVGGTPIHFGVDASGDFGAGVRFNGGSVDLQEGGLVTLNVQHGDYRGSINDEGAFTLQQNLSDFAASGATSWGGFSVNADGDVSLVLDQSRRGDDGFTSFTSGIIDLQTGEATTTVTNNATFADVLDQYRNGTSPYLLSLLPNIRTGEPEVPDIESTVDTTGDVYEEREDFSPPEQDEYLEEIMDKVDAVAPAGEMEEVVVTAPYLGPEPGMTTAPDRTDSDRSEDGPTAGEGGLSSQEEIDEAKENVGKAALALDELRGSPLAAAGNQVLDIQEAAEKVQKALDDPTPTNIMAAQAAVNKVLGDLAEVVKHPDSALAKQFASVAGVAANLVAFADESLPLNDRLRAAVSIVGAMGGPAAKRASEVFLTANDLGSALHTFGNSAGAVDPDTGLTPFQETADEALAIELAARAQGDAYEAAIRDTGAATAAALAEVTGLDVADEVAAVFDDVGSRAGSLFDGVGHAVAVTHVVTSALGDALEGSIRATVARLGGG